MYAVHMSNELRNHQTQLTIQAQSVSMYAISEATVHCNCLLWHVFFPAFLEKLSSWHMKSQSRGLKDKQTLARIIQEEAWPFATHLNTHKLKKSCINDFRGHYNDII